MNTAHQQLAEELPATTPAARFRLIQGNRNALAAVQTPAPLAAVPSRRYRGLTLVSRESASVSLPQKLDPFDQARRIVAQVEQEIQQRAARERTKFNRRWYPLQLAAAGVAITSRALAPTPKADRLRRFFGL